MRNYTNSKHETKRIEILFLGAFIIFFSIILLLNIKGNNLVSTFILSFSFSLLILVIDKIKSVLRARYIKTTHLDKYPIITQYEPPSNIHPAIAGFLIDKKIEKKEVFATLFHSIINGHIVIDERIESNKFNYYLLKNKGFNESMTCDRIISDQVFMKNDKYFDSRLFQDIDIKISSFFLNSIKSKLLDCPALFIVLKSRLLLIVILSLTGDPELIAQDNILG